MSQSFAFPTTLYLVPGALQALSDVSVNPGSAQNGYPLTWNNTAGKWQAEQVAYSNLSGAPALPIPVDSGGTGTQTGSITGTGALTFASGANGNISLTPNGTGAVLASGDFTVNVRSQPNQQKGFVINLEQGSNNTLNGFYLRKGAAQFSLVNGEAAPTGWLPFFFATNNPDQTSQLASLIFYGQFPTSTTNPAGEPYTFVADWGVLSFQANDLNSPNIRIPDHYRHFCVWNTLQGYNTSNPSALLFVIFGNGNARLKGNLTIQGTEVSTSTTTGALQVAGGIGAQGNLIVGGTRINFANLPTSSTGLAVGDLWRDGDVVKVKI